MVDIIFETHATSLDNEAGVASGHYDVALSPTGERQAHELGERYGSGELDCVFCSDLQRSYRTAEIAFPSAGIRLVRDGRLRECDYGRFTRKAAEVVQAERARRIDEPFPGGESYRQALRRIQSFLEWLGLPTERIAQIRRDSAGRA